MRLLLQNIYHLVIGNKKKDRLRNVDLLIEDERISQIGPNLPKDNAQIIDASTKLVLPGFVNCHHHFYQTLQRNIPAAQNANLFKWLTTLYPIWSHLSKDAVQISTKLACAELLKTGCTTTCDHHYVFPNKIDDDLILLQFLAAQEMGIRFCALRGSMSLGKNSGGLPPESVVQDEKTILADSERLIATHHNPDPFSMQHLALAPCSPFSVSKDLMKKTASLARKHNVRLHTHLAETKDEETYCLAHYQKRPLELMESLGWLGNDVWFAHGIYFNDQELDLLAKTKTKICHCPASNMRLGSGICRVTDMRKKNITVGLGVDGSASNDSSDMLGELRNCLLLQRVANGPEAITADDVLDMATLSGAEILSWPTIGSLEIGKAADVILIEMNRLDYAGALSDPLAAIIFSGISHNIHTSIVNGKIVVSNGKLVNIDEDDLRDQANQIAKQMLKAEGHSTKWML